MPFKRKVPLIGKVSTRIAISVCPASASVKAKFALVSVSVVSSEVVTVTLALSGGVLAPTNTFTVLVAVPPLPSDMEYAMVAVPLKFSAGTNCSVPSMLIVTAP